MIYHRFYSHSKFLLTILALLLCNVTVVAATEHTIADGATTNTKPSFANNDTVHFTGTATNGATGVLNHNLLASTSLTLGSILSDHSNVGIVKIVDSSRNLIVSGDIGSTTNKIQEILFQGSGPGTLTVNGNIYVNNISTDTDSTGTLHLFNSSNASISANIGSTSLHLNQIDVYTSNKSFYGNLYVKNFNVQSGGTATISGSGTNSIGAVTLNDGTLNINKDTTATSLTMGASSTLGVAAGAKLTLSAASTINGTLNVGMLDSRSTNLTPSISSTDTVNVANTATTINFDYANATYLKQTDGYQFLTSPSAINYTPANITVTGHTFLLSTPTITNVTGATNALRVNLTLDTTNLDKLGTTDKAAVNFLLNATHSGADFARTEMLKLSTQAQVESTVETLQIDKSNMAQRSSLDLHSAAANTIDRHLQSLSYNQFTFFKKDQMLKTRNRSLSESDVRNPNAGYSQSRNFDRSDKKTFYVADDGDKTLWGEFFGGASKQGNDGSVKGFDSKSRGLSFGHDKISKDANVYSVFGGAFSYGKSNTESRATSNQKTQIDAYQLSIYSHNMASNGLGIFNEFALDAGYNRYNSERTIKLGSYQSKAGADFSGLQYGAKFGVGNNIAVNNKTIFSPIVAIKYFGLQLQDYSETNGNNLGLKVKNDRFDLFTSEIGFRLNGDIDSRVRPQLNVSWLHNLNPDGAESSTTFVNGAANQEIIQNNGVDLDADILNIGAGFNFKTSENTTMMVKYDLQKSSNFTSHLGAVKFNWLFF